MPTTHVWLLDRGGPEAEAEVRPWLEAIARDPTTTPLPGWMVFLLAWAWSHWAARRVVPVCRQIGGPAPQLADARTQASLLARTLGRRYAVHPVFRKGGEDARRAHAALGRGDQVVLLPLHPQRHPAASGAALADAWRVLSGGAHPATALDGWGHRPALLDLLAQRTRAALIELQDAGRVGLVLAAAAPPRLGTAAADGYVAELVETATRLRARLRFAGPVVQCWLPALAGPAAPAPDLPTALQTCRSKGAQSAILVPLGCTTSWPELRMFGADALAEASGLKRVRWLAPLAPSTEFSRVLAELVRAAEREAGWEVPEDDVRVEIEAELRAAGHVVVQRATP